MTIKSEFKIAMFGSPEAECPSMEFMLQHVPAYDVAEELEQIPEHAKA
jgi:hypothetical protein